jgi:Ni,Fe-hydrogenase III large subunit
MLRTHHALFGHRYLMDAIIPGGVAHDMDFPGSSRMVEEIAELEQDVARLKHIFEDHAVVQDRFRTTGRVRPDLAARLGLTGLPGRASSQAWDLRAQFPSAPYDELDVRMATHRKGDVAARVTVRFEELIESMRLCRAILQKIPEGDIRTRLNPIERAGLGIGWVEGWRGEILLALHVAQDGTIQRAHAHDPSWHNWPVLEHAVIGNFVPDFPLINKSFNLSYSGHDL